MKRRMLFSFVIIFLISLIIGEAKNTITIDNNVDIFTFNNEVQNLPPEVSPEGSVYYIDLNNPPTAPLPGLSYVNGIYSFDPSAAGNSYVFTGTTTEDRIVVGSGVGTEEMPLNITLDGVTMNTYNAPIAIDSSSVVEITLADGSVNTTNCTSASGNLGPGIQVNYLSHLIINGTGTLYAQGAFGAAGIGGGIGSGSTGKNGLITINSGTIYATGGDQAPGIGGGQSGEVGEIEINGGNVIAVGKGQAAGIGPAQWGSGGIVEISREANVLATSTGYKNAVQDADGANSATMPANLLSISLDVAPAAGSTLQATNTNDIPFMFANGTYEIPMDGQTKAVAFTTNTYDGPVYVNAYNDGEMYGRVLDIAYNYSPVTMTSYVTGDHYINGSPQPSVTSFATNEDTVLNDDLNFVDSDPITYELVSETTNGTLEFNTSNSDFRYTPNPNFSGTDSFVVSASDNYATTTATIYIEVIEVPDKPTANDLTLNTDEDTSIGGTLTATDGDSPSLTYSIDMLSLTPNSGTVVLDDPTTGAFTYTPAPNYYGKTTFEFSATDGATTSYPATVTINVAPIDDNPLAQDNNFSVVEEGVLVETIDTGQTGTDADGEVISISVASQPQNGTVTVNSDGTFEYIPNSNFSGTDSFTYTVSDGNIYGVDPTGTVYIEVTEVNDTPIASDIFQTTDEDITISSNLNAIDPENSALTYTIDPTSLDANSGIVTLDDATTGAYTYIPAPNYNGTTTFEYSATDGTDISNVGIVTIEVAPIEDDPIAEDNYFTISEDEVLSETIVSGQIGTDVDGEAVIITLDRQPQNGTVTVNPNGTFEYIPNSNYNGSDSFTYKVSDGNLVGTDPVGTVYIDITSVDDVPVASNITISTNEDTQISDVLNATDPENEPLIYSIDSASLDVNSGTITLDDEVSGTYTYVPAANYNGTTTFEYTATDGTTVSNTATVTIEVVPVDDDPISIENNLNTTEDTELSAIIDSGQSGVDVDNDPITISAASQPQNGTVTVNTDGSFTYTPNPDFTGIDTFTYIVSDGNDTGADAIGTVNIDVTSVNDIPVASDITVSTDEDITYSDNMIATDIESSILTYSIDTTSMVAGSGTVTIDDETTGAYTYVPAANYNGVTSFEYTATDGYDVSNTATVTIEVAPVDDDPIADENNFETDEDTELSAIIDSGQSGFDVDNDPITISAATQPQNGSVTVNADGSFVYVPNSNFTGTDSFTYSVNDGNETGNDVIGTVNIDVTSVNDAPIASDSTELTDEDTSVTGNLNATDAESSALTYSVNAASLTPGSGTITLDDATTGAYTYVPAANYNGTTTFEFTASDGTGVSNTATVTIEVAPVDDDPIANENNFETDEDTELSAIIDSGQSGFDVDGDPITISVVSQPQNGTVTANADGSFLYTPNLDFTGLDSFTYAVNDGNAVGTDAIGTVNIIVTPMNDNPVVSDINISTDEDVLINSNLSATDTENDVLTYEIDTATLTPDSGTLTLDDPATGAYTFVPATNFNGTASFEYTATDEFSTSNIATVTIEVKPIDDDPIAKENNFTTPEDAEISGVIDSGQSGVDVDNEPITISLESQPQNGNVTVASDGTFTYIPDTDFVGIDSFTYKVSDGNIFGTDTIGTVNIDVTSINDVPVASDITINTDEDITYIGTVSATDVENDTITYSIDELSMPANTGSITLDDTSTGGFTYVPAANFNGVTSFKYTASDAFGTSTVATVTINVTPIDDDPIAIENEFTTSEDTVLNETIDSGQTITDVDGDPITIRVGTQPQNGSVVVNSDGTFTYTPNANYVGQDSFTYIVDDGNITGNDAVSTVYINVTSTNDTPIVSDMTINIDEDTTYSGNLSATDIENDTLTYSIDSSGMLVTEGTVILDNATTGAFTFTPSTNYNGTTSFEYSVTDGTSVSNIATVTIVVAPVDDNPVANDNYFTSTEDTDLSEMIISGQTTTDVDGDIVSISIDTEPQYGSVILNTDGTFIYSPNPDFEGTDSFTYKVNDGNLIGEDAVATVYIEVLGTNDTPIASDITIDTEEDVPIVSTLSATDIDNDPLIYSIDTSEMVPTAGSITLDDQNSGAFSYTPTLNYNGTTTFTYSVSDGNTTSNIATVTINVAAIDDNPIAIDNSFTVDEDTALNTVIDSGQLGTDVDGDAVSISLATQPQNGIVEVNTDGTFIYTPNDNFTGSDSFTYFVSDGNVTGEDAIATVYIEVLAVNDAPIANNVNFATDEDTPFNANMNGTDIDNDTLTYTIDMNSVSPTAGAVTLDDASLGTFTFSPASNYNGETSFNYTVTDGNIVSNVATVTIDIAAIDDNPLANDNNFTTGEDIVLDETINSGQSITDVDGDEINISIGTSPSNGTVNVNNNGTFTYTPSADYVGQDSFTYIVSDGNAVGEDAIGTVYIDITSINDAPVVPDITVNTDEDIAFVGNLSATDTENDVVTYDINTNSMSPTCGTISLDDASTGAYTYIPTFNFNGTATFEYTATDGTDISNTGTVTINVAPVDDNPIAIDNNFMVGEDTELNETIYSGQNGTDVDGDQISISVATQPQNGTVTVNADGTFTYLPTSNYVGPDSFTYSVNDGNDIGEDAVATVYIEVLEIGDVPVATDVEIYGDEDTSISGQLNAVDTDSQNLIYKIDTSSITPAGGNLTLDNTATGEFTYIPSANYNGDVSFKYTVSDGVSTSNVANVTIHVAPIDDNPLANDNNTTTVEDTPLNSVIDSGQTGTDIDGDTITISAASQPQNGTVTVNADGTYLYTPNANFTGIDSFTYAVNDANIIGEDTIGTVYIDVTSVNDAPVANDISLSTNEDIVYTGDLVATDLENDDLIYTINTDSLAANSGTVTLDNENTGTFTFTPGVNFNGTTAFEYSVTDGFETSNTATVTINVLPVDDNPNAEDNYFTTNEDTPVNEIIYSGQGSTDIDGDTISISLGNEPENGTVSLSNDGSFTYTPNSNFVGSDSFTYIVSDGNATGVDTIATVYIEVLEVSDAPIANDVLINSNEDTTIVAQLDASDVDSQNLTYEIDMDSISPQIGNLTLDNPATGEFTYVPEANYSGTITFDYTVSDGVSTSNIATTTINIAPIDDNPVAIDNEFVTNEDIIIEDVISSGQIGTDIDGDPITISVASQPQNGTVSVNSDGSFTYTPNSNYFGTDSFTYIVNDGNVIGEDAIGTVNIIVSEVGDAPTVDDIALSANEDNQISGQLNATDVDSQNLTYSIDTDSITPNSGTVVLDDQLTGTFTYTPALDYNGVTTFNYTASDGTSVSNIGTVTISVNPLDDDPKAVDNNIQVAEDTPYNGTIDTGQSNTDVDGDIITFNKTSEPQNGTVTVNPDGTFIYTPNSNFVGTDSFTYSVSDGNTTGQDANAAVNIEVVEVGDAPAAQDIVVDYSEDTAVNEMLVASDTDSTNLTYSINMESVVPATGTLTLTDNTIGSFTYVPAPNYTGQVTFEYTASDGINTSNIATVTMNFDPVDDDPNANNCNFILNEDESYSESIEAIDVDGDILTYSVVSNPSNGSVAINSSGQFVYTPNLNYVGTDSFVYEVSDGNATGENATGTVFLEINPINDAPVVENNELNTYEDTSVNGIIVGTDIENNVLSYEVVTEPNNGSVSVDSTTGKFTYTPSVDYIGVDSFTVSATDGDLNSTEATITINVVKDTEAPITEYDEFNGEEDTTLSGNVAGNDINNLTASNALTYTSDTTSARGGTVNMDTEGNFTYAPPTNFYGMDSFNYIATDVNGLISLETTVIINVNGVNDVPISVDDVFVTDQALSITETVASNDMDVDINDTLSYSVVVAPSNGIVTMENDGTFTYTPKEGYFGVDTFTYVATDSSGGISEETTVSINVNEVNVAPDAVDDLVSVVTGDILLSNVYENDLDNNGDILTYELESSPLHGEIDFNPDGTFKYTPESNYIGTDTFTYSVSDGIEADTATVTINVTEEIVMADNETENSTPESQDDSQSVNSETTLEETGSIAAIIVLIPIISSLVIVIYIMKKK